MKVLTQNEFQKLSFPGAKIEEMKIDTINKILEIKVNSGHLDIDGGVELNSCYLSITNWESIKATIYHAKTKNIEILDINKLDKLDDICEFEFGNILILRGFGVKGGWIEIIVEKPILKVVTSQ